MGAMSSREHAATVAEHRFDPRAALAGAAGLAGAGAGLVGVKLLTGVGVACPFRALTGLLCPLCGSTAMGVALVRGDLASAWGHNPLVLTGFLALAVSSLVWIIEILGGPAVRPPSWMRPVTQRRAYLAGGVVLTLFGVLRNLA